MNPFTAHPRSHGQTYGQHWAFALGIALLTLQAALAAMVHAFLPFLFESTASRLLDAVHERIQRARLAAQLR